CDVRSIIVLLQENQLKRDDIFIIGVECSGVIAEHTLASGKESPGELDFDEKCKACRPSTPRLYDYLVSQKDQKDKGVLPEENPYQDIRKFEAKSIEERFKFWQEEFSRCIRCYACRQICPMCYCPRCVADQTMPTWFSRAPDLEGNLAWNVIRAFHLAGRCIDCGECERACPVGIPLREVNKKIEKDIKELFDYEAGAGVDQKPLLSCFDQNDPEDFIR
ncbi:MAG TPA: coenzyme F420 hydrogenase, partial [Proteobacteria bacterium]|nr:coenzyme F420 hydrogenase [Pseudomonadota bacterium]